jgi:putative transposase
VPDINGAPLALACKIMPRIPRTLLVEEGSTNHCTWRSHGHAMVLDTDAAREQFISLLGKYKEKFGITIHSYCLMGTHPHVMCLSTKGQQAFSAFWKLVNWGFARWYNRRTEGRGQVVMERLRSPRIQDGRHQLQVMRYGDLNPVRAGLVKSPKHWRWSSYRHYAFGEPDDLVTDAPEYTALGRYGPERRAAYQHLFASAFATELCFRRPDLVYGPFVGDRDWVTLRLEACGLEPPS